MWITLHTVIVLRSKIYQKCNSKKKLLWRIWLVFNLLCYKTRSFTLACTPGPNYRVWNARTVWPDYWCSSQFFLLLPWGLQRAAGLCIESTSVLLGWTGVLGRSVGDKLELSAPTKEMEVIFFPLFHQQFAQPFPVMGIGHITVWGPRMTLTAEHECGTLYLQHSNS